MTSGTNLFVKKSDVIYLDISNESALQYMLTAGAVMPRRQEHEEAKSVRTTASGRIKKSSETTSNNLTPRKEVSSDGKNKC